MKGYIYVCDEFVETGLVFEDLRRRERIVPELFSAFRECVGVEAESAELVRSVMARDWAVLEYEVRAKFATLRARVVFTDGDPAKALEEAERVAWRGGGP